MSTTRDWLRASEAPEKPDRGGFPLKSVLIWAAVVALATYAVLALLQLIG